eukprot:9187992-Pyramimonas_sp.AAC.1
MDRIASGFGMIGACLIWSIMDFRDALASRTSAPKAVGPPYFISSEIAKPSREDASAALRLAR